MITENKISKFLKEFEKQEETVIDTPKDELNQQFFDGTRLQRRIRKSMLDLFNFVISKLPFKDLNKYVLEKNFVGSMASFQWSDESDIDLHIVVDDEEMAEQYNIDSLELIEILRKMRKEFNDKFYIMGYEVEFYIQTKNEPFYSNGVYDVEYDTWIKAPQKQEFDKEKVKEAKQQATKYKKYIQKKIKQIHKDIKNEEKASKNYEFLQDELDRLVNERNESIRAEGHDATIINMTWKFLQRFKVIKQIKDTIDKLEKNKFEVK